MSLSISIPQVGSHNSSMFGTVLRAPTRPMVRQNMTSTITAGIVGPGKKWEHYETNANGKVVRPPMHVRLGDTVQVVSGSDKGKVGKVTTVITKTGQVVVDGVNIKFRHVKPRAQGESGQIVQRESPIHHSNVMLYSESQKVRSRVSYRTKPDGTKVRVLVKTGEELPLSNKPEKKEGGESSSEQ